MKHFVHHKFQRQFPAVQLRPSDDGKEKLLTFFVNGVFPFTFVKNAFRISQLLHSFHYFLLDSCAVAQCMYTLYC